MTEPNVNVLICNYNYRDYILDALKSVYTQDYPNISFTIVDDCSTDNSCEVVLKNSAHRQINESFLREEEIEAKYQIDLLDGYHAVDIRKTGVLIRLKTNGGPSRARNIGLLHAMRSGASFIQRLDADDIMRPTKVSELIRPMLSDPNIGLTYADYTILNTVDGTETYESKEPYSISRLQQECIIHSGFLISCKVLEKIAYGEQGKPWPFFFLECIKTAEDYNLELRAMKHFISIHVAQNLTLVRNHPQNSTFSISDEEKNRNYQICKQHAFSQ